MGRTPRSGHDGEPAVALEQAPGRREQQRRATRARLAGAARRLFTEQGFEQTTVDEIAAAAGVARRTFFLHFATKEDAVLARYDDFERALAAAVRAAPPAPTVLAVAEHAVTATLAQFDPEEARAPEALVRDTPALRARAQGKQEWMERTIADALAARSGVAPSDLGLRVDALLTAAVLRVALEGWAAAAAAGVTTAEHVRRVVAAFERGLGGGPAPAGPPRKRAAPDGHAPRGVTRPAGGRARPPLEPH